MSFIKVGIYENLHFSEATTKINDKGSLELGITTKLNNDAMVAAFRGNETIEQAEGKFIIFPPSMVTFDTKQPFSAPEMAGEFTKLRTRFLTYAKLFTTKEVAEKALGGIAMFDGLGVTPEDVGKAIAQLTVEAWMKKVYVNLCNKFIAFLKANHGMDGTMTFRHKFPRQSSDKQYAGLGSSEYEVFVESMSVPAEASKVCWSEWEVKNNRNHGNPVASTKGKSQAADATKAASLFSAPAASSTNAPDLFNKAEQPVAETKDVDNTTTEKAADKPVSDLFTTKKD